MYRLPEWFWDLGLNLFAEAAGVAVTIFVVDRWARGREVRRLRPMLGAALSDARRIYHDLLSLVELALISAATTEDLVLLREAGLRMSDPRIEAILNRLSMTQCVKVVRAGDPTISYLAWRDYLPQAARQARERAFRFQERYSYVVDPALTAAVHAVGHSALLTLASEYADLVRGGRHSFGNLFAGAVTEAQQLRTAIRALCEQLEPGAPVEDNYTSDQIANKVIQEVERHPVWTESAPYRPRA